VSGWAGPGLIRPSFGNACLSGPAGGFAENVEAVTTTTGPFVATCDGRTATIVHRDGDDVVLLDTLLTDRSATSVSWPSC
jgi:hypothetical protein